MAFKLASLVIVAAFLGVGAVSLSILSRSSASDGPVEKVGAPALAVNAPAGLDDALRPVTSNALPSTEQGGVILVIAPAGITPAELPVWKDVAGRRARVEVVSTMAAARSLAASHVAAIVIENRTVEEVDWGWIQERFGSGTTVAGLNVGMGRLLELLYPASASLDGDEALGWVRGAPDEDWTSERRFYSVLSGAPCAGGRTNVYDDPGTETDVVTALVHKQCGSAPVGIGFE